MTDLMSSMLSKILTLLPKDLISCLDLIGETIIEKPVLELFTNILKFVCHVVDEVKKTKYTTACQEEMRGKMEKVVVGCDIVLDVTWEKMNSGHWKDVPLQWRHLYAFTSLNKALLLILQSSITNQSVNKIIHLEIIKVCDMSLLMAPPILNNIHAKIASLLHKNLQADPNSLNLHSENILTAAIKPAKVSLENLTKKRRIETVLIDMNKEIKKIVCPDLISFLEGYLRPHIPVIITNAIDFWPAFDSKSKRKWDINYMLKLAGYRTVPIEIGSKYTEENWSQKLVTINEFIDNYLIKNDPLQVGYLAQHNLFDQIEELKHDFSIPDYCSLSLENDNDETEPQVDINAWFGPQGTVSPLHYDAKDNLLVQVMGCKYVRLYPDKTPAEWIYPHKTTLLHNTSEVDIENIDSKKYPLFKKAKYIECVLSEGEMLFVPQGYWHFVRSLSPSFSISFWWK